nr:MAG TPA: hypothetical protein [Caudoviricetes sp.]
MQIKIGSTKGRAKVLPFSSAYFFCFQKGEKS